MEEPVDIRDKEIISDGEIKALNFIQNSSALHFRRYNRQGLRSHIFEILDSHEVEKESRGELVDGYRRFPRAMPRYMLRILRSRFTSVEAALDEINKYTRLLHFLGPELIARSNEFIVDYVVKGTHEIMLCGIQEYVDGVILNPWHLLEDAPLKPYFPSPHPADNETEKRISICKKSISKFVRLTWKMISKTGYIPDLAGNGNLLLCKTGTIKLVDINNIIKVETGDKIILDDKGYPACDKSIEVLALLMEKILADEEFPINPTLGHFLSEKRKTEVRRLEKIFFQSFNGS